MERHPWKNDAALNAYEACILGSRQQLLQAKEKVKGAAVEPGSQLGGDQLP